MKSLIFKGCLTGAAALIGAVIWVTSAQAAEFNWSLDREVYFCADRYALSISWAAAGQILLYYSGVSLNGQPLNPEPVLVYNMPPGPGKAELQGTFDCLDQNTGAFSGYLVDGRGNVSNTLTWKVNRFKVQTPAVPAAADVIKGNTHNLFFTVEDEGGFGGIGPVNVGYQISPGLTGAVVSLPDSLIPTQTGAMSISISGETVSQPYNITIIVSRGSFSRSAVAQMNVINPRRLVVAAVSGVNEPGCSQRGSECDELFPVVLKKLNTGQVFQERDCGQAVNQACKITSPEDQALIGDQYQAVCPGAVTGEIFNFQNGRRYYYSGQPSGQNPSLRTISEGDPSIVYLYCPYSLILESSVFSPQLDVFVRQTLLDRLDVGRWQQSETWIFPPSGLSLVPVPIGNYYLGPQILQTGRWQLDFDHLREPDKYYFSSTDDADFQVMQVPSEIGIPEGLCSRAPEIFGSHRYCKYLLTVNGGVYVYTQTSPGGEVRYFNSEGATYLDGYYAPLGEIAVDLIKFNQNDPDDVYSASISGGIDLPRAQTYAGVPLVFGRWHLTPPHALVYTVICSDNQRGRTDSRTVTLNDLDDNGLSAKSAQVTCDFSPQPKTLAVELAALPASGLAPLSAVLRADVSGTANGTINYAFWWDCNYGGTDLTAAIRQCGDPDGPLGNSWGNKFEATNSVSQVSIPHLYAAAVVYQAKVIVERGDLAAEDRVLLSVSPPVLGDSPLVSGVRVLEPDYCSSGPAALIGWIYAHPRGLAQSAFQMRIDDQDSFRDPAVDTGRIQSDQISLATGQGQLEFDTVYQARVRVWDSEGAVSDWTEQTLCSGPGCLGGGEQWRTPLHAYPEVRDFTWQPPEPQIRQPVQFTDQTIFYDQGRGARFWSWDFQDPPPASEQNPVHTFSRAGVFNITETVTDQSGYICRRTLPLEITKPNPFWKEVQPQ